MPNEDKTEKKDEKKKNFRYKYKRSHAGIWVAVVIIVIILAGAAFVLSNSERLSPQTNDTSTKNQTNQTTQGQQNGSLTGTTLPPPEQNTTPPAPPAQNETPPTPPAPPMSQAGLKAEYFDTTTLAGTPVSSEIVQNINFVWSDTNQPAGVNWQRFSARFMGKLIIEKAGDYTFIITSDDGSRFYIDNQTAGQNIWDSTGTISTSAFRTMTAGEHNIKVEYRNIGGGAAKLKLEYWASTLNISRHVIPPSAFRTA